MIQLFLICLACCSSCPSLGSSWSQWQLSCSLAHHLHLQLPCSARCCMSVRAPQRLKAIALQLNTKKQLNTNCARQLKKASSRDILTEKIWYICLDKSNQDIIYNISYYIYSFVYVIYITRFTVYSELLQRWAELNRWITLNCIWDQNGPPQSKEITDHRFEFRARKTADCIICGATRQRGAGLAGVPSVAKGCVTALGAVAQRRWQWGDPSHTRCKLNMTKHD